MSDWFKSTPESERLLSEERLILAATEKVYEAMEHADATKKTLAERLGVSKSEIGQRLSGRRNLTVRSLAAMLHALGAEATLSIRPVTPSYAVPRNDLVTFRQNVAANRSTYKTAPVVPTLQPELAAG